MKEKKILYIFSVVHPYSKYSNDRLPLNGIHLPQKVKQDKNDVRIFTPRYGSVNQRRYQIHEVKRLSGINLIVNDIDQPLLIKVASIPKESLQVYFIDNSEFFDRKEYWYHKDTKDMFDDNDERAIFFIKGVLETTKKLNWIPDIVHIHGWFSHFLPLYIKTLYKEDPVFKSAKVVLSLYDESYESVFPSNLESLIATDNISTEWQNRFKDIGPCSIESLTKICVENTDAIIKHVDEKVNENVLQHIEEQGKKLHEVGNLTQVIDLYKSLLAAE